MQTILRFQEHPEADVRFAVTHALGGLENEQAIQALIDLSADPDHDARNWATFNLGSLIDTDSSSIREALVARLDEPDDEIRGEAIVGLSRRGDARAIPALMNLFDKLSPEVLRDWILMEETAEAITAGASRIPDVKWATVLRRYRELGIGNAHEIQVALEKCDLCH